MSPVDRVVLALVAFAVLRQDAKDDKTGWDRFFTIVSFIGVCAYFGAAFIEWAGIWWAST